MTTPSPKPCDVRVLAERLRRFVGLAENVIHEDYLYWMTEAADMLDRLADRREDCSERDATQIGSSTQNDAVPLSPTSGNYAQMFAALSRIAAYQSPEELREGSEDEYGVDADEAIEMAYENVLAEAAQGIKGVKKP